MLQNYVLLLMNLSAVDLTYVSLYSVYDTHRIISQKKKKKEKEKEKESKYIIIGWQIPLQGEDFHQRKEKKEKFSAPPHRELSCKSLRHNPRTSLIG